MLRAEPLVSNRPDGAGLCAGADSGQWTGEKRSKHLGPSPPPCDTIDFADARIGSSCSSDGPGGGQRESEHTICKVTWEKEEELDIGEEVPEPDFLRCEDALSKRPRICFTQREFDPETQRQVYQRLVLCQIKAYKLSQGESIANLDDVELPLFLNIDMPRCDLEFHVAGYIRSEIEKDGPFDWYFDTLYSRFEELDDYQRLVLRNRLTPVGCKYWAWEEYHSMLTTYEMDKDYVKFFEEVSSKLKWLTSHVQYPESSVEWSEVYLRGLRQVMKIAAEPKFPHLTSSLAYTAYEEHIWTLRFDYYYREDMDRLFFEIWKRVSTTRQTTFAAALSEVLCENLVPRHKDYMQNTLDDPSSSDLEERYNSCVEGMPGNASEEVAKMLIIEAVWKPHEANQMLHKYMAEKMKIAESIGLVK